MNRMDRMPEFCPKGAEFRFEHTNPIFLPRSAHYVHSVKYSTASVAGLCVWLFAIAACECFAQERPDLPPVVIDYFFAAGCPDCTRVKERILPELASRCEGFYKVNQFDVNNKSNVVALFAYQERLNIVSNAPVMMVVDYRYVFNGFPVIEKNLFQCMDRCVQERLAPGWKPPEPIPIPRREGADVVLAEARLKRFTLPAVLGAGFTDGINPCAIGTLVFFMSLLSVSGVTGRRLLLVGIPFCFASFVTYSAIGFGLLQAIHTFEGFPRARRIVEAGMVLLLGIFAVLSFVDAWRYGRSGNAKDVILQLPGQVKERIHNVMRSGIRSGNLVVGALTIGALVTILESVCTGQVYVPTLALIVKTGPSTLRASIYLLFYNLMFLAPLVTVFVLTYFGLKTVALLDWSRRSVVLSKVLLGLFFTVMAVLIAVL